MVTDFWTNFAASVFLGLSTSLSIVLFVRFRRDISFRIPEFKLKMNFQMPKLNQEVHYRINIVGTYGYSQIHVLELNLKIAPNV